MNENRWGPEAAVSLLCSRQIDGLDGPTMAYKFYAQWEGIEVEDNI